MTPPQPHRPEPPQRTPRRGLFAAVAALLVAVPAALYLGHDDTPQDVGGPAAAAPAATKADRPRAKAAPPARQDKLVARYADFGREHASTDVRRLAHWVADSRDNGARAFVVIDKREARVYLFDPQARLQAAAPALLGSARGDDTAPGVGDKPIAEVLDEEKTTPAGRFIAEVGESSSRGEDVVWVDYDAAVSMHRIIQVPERLRAMATPTPEDNRMSFGCINLPVPFYEQALRPTVDRTGAVVYVLPETRSLQQTFASFYDVRTQRSAGTKLAQR